MAGKVITLKKDAVCTQCGRELSAGEEARYYSNDKIYCPGEHLGQEKKAGTGSSAPKAQPTAQPKAQPKAEANIDKTFESAINAQTVPILKSQNAYLADIAKELKQLNKLVEFYVRTPGLPNDK